MKIKLYNKISPKGLSRVNRDLYEVGEDIQGEDGILVRSAKLHDLDFNDNLKAIVRAGAGVNNIPIDRCSENGIVVFNTPGANANAVKELVFAGMLLSARPVFNAMTWVETLTDTEDVATLVEKEKSKFTGNELRGKKLGIIGLGAIGIKVANLALHFGMEVYGYDPYISIASAWQLSRKVHYAKTMDELYEKCDYLSIHVPLSDKTRNMVDEEAISKMKENVCILNFARGGLVDEDAICKALDENRIKNYVCDFPNSKILHQKGVICIPHLGASTPESEENCAIMAVNQITDFLENGNILNSVNLPNVTLDRSGEARVTCFHKNTPNMIAQISQTISDGGMNIENLINKSKGDYAYTIVDVNSKEVASVAEQLQKIPEILRVTIL
ncbi:D-3-phosphoglycerate dehydrogenase [Breznakia sp. PF5-3]|uniref:3-phosphoglycerate dehydrogenase family protein n=1 Tax=unclassified Breznakia TaxID=2623764 RepID=UPI0024053B7F|nr:MULTISPECIES: 3-phosphoglycerate dehydrogenase family protein [unclassified Breznakia]MDF9823725.1 D-3-phosphoglycerate dehydrogenase [Breznakia sp. PM6-1]MDF9834523.1 D-3-phosphoglycerate dehydrogenase [Breznakia sp. PF5-3]MDF9837506.1 D-3-phosphoglycerate dehydrogenase [Breznakia sp. PFB2-8]MDF9859083.1 D-3-phosphoglycerate dehydrogenase [Breznakia sp. PH5-24]